MTILGPNGQPIKSAEPEEKHEDDKIRIFFENDPFAVAPAPKSDMSNFFLCCTYKDQKWRERLTNKLAADPEKHQNQFEFRQISNGLYRKAQEYIEAEDAGKS